MTRKEVIHELCKELGLKANLKGYNYIKVALEIILEHPEQLDYMTNRLYPSIADITGTTSSRVERSIRHAIECMVDTCPSETVYSVFGNVISPLKGKPTNSEFLAGLREEILIREERYNHEMG